MKSISELVNNIIEGWDHNLPEVQQNLDSDIYEPVWDALRERELERDYYGTDANLEALPDSAELQRIEAHPKYES